MHPTWGEGGGVGRGRGVAEGYAPCLRVGYCRKVVFEGLSRGVRGDALACRGHPYMFQLTPLKFNFNAIKNLIFENQTIFASFIEKFTKASTNLYMLDILSQNEYPTGQERTNFQNFNS